MCYNVCVYEESVHSLETGNTGVCELPDVIAGIYTSGPRQGQQVLSAEPSINLATTLIVLF